MKAWNSFSILEQVEHSEFCITFLIRHASSIWLAYTPHPHNSSLLRFLPPIDPVSNICRLPVTLFFSNWLCVAGTKGVRQAKLGPTSCCRASGAVSAIRELSSSKTARSSRTKSAAPTWPTLTSSPLSSFVHFWYDENSHLIPPPFFFTSGIRFLISAFFGRCWTCSSPSLWTTLIILRATRPSLVPTTWTSLSEYGLNTTPTRRNIRNKRNSTNHSTDFVFSFFLFCWQRENSLHGNVRHVKKYGPATWFWQ